MPPPPWSPSNQYLDTVLNEPSSHAAPPPQTTQTPPRARPQLHEPAQEPFSAAQRSAQARGKPFDNAPTTRGTGTGTSTSTSSRPTAVLEAESYAQRERRNEAAAILDSAEMLMWYAAARYESVPQTRRYYTNIVMGVAQDEVLWREEWEVNSDAGARGVGTASPRGKGGRSGKGKEREREKERGTPRKRASAGASAAGDGEAGGGGTI